jgi:hypothetical protein
MKRRSVFMGLMLLGSVTSVHAAPPSQASQANQTSTAVSQGSSPSVDASTPTGKGVKYKSGKDVNFEELLIQGQLKRAEITVVTGNVDDGTNGLLRLREDFLDRMTADAGEEMTEGVK